MANSAVGVLNYSQICSADLLYRGESFDPLLFAAPGHTHVNLFLATLDFLDIVCNLRLKFLDLSFVVRGSRAVYRRQLESLIGGNSVSIDA